MNIKENIFLEPHIIKTLSENNYYKKIMIDIGNILIELDKYDMDVRKLSNKECNVKSNLELELEIELKRIIPVTYGFLQPGIDGNKKRKSIFRLARNLCKKI
jgi:hypothetical protein